jgi:sigma-E factor negative regulatory protein RseA
MHDEEVNQNISGFIDGELSYVETIDLLKKLQIDDILKAKMCRYQAISQALKTDEFYEVKPGFSSQVFQAIQNEPTHFLPQLKPILQERHNSRNKMFAIAASTVAAVVLIGQNLRDNPPNNSFPSITAMSVPAQQLPASFTQRSQLKQNNTQPLNKQFNDYLQAHNSSVYTNGEANFQPYAKVASYGQR